MCWKAKRKHRVFFPLNCIWLKHLLRDWFSCHEQCEMCNRSHPLYQLAARNLKVKLVWKVVLSYKLKIWKKTRNIDIIILIIVLVNWANCTIPWVWAEQWGEGWKREGGKGEGWLASQEHEGSAYCFRIEFTKYDSSWNERDLLWSASVFSEIMLEWTHLKRKYSKKSFLNL